MDDQQTVSNSDINWASGERPTVAIVCAIIGVAVGYVGGLEGLLWWVGSSLTPFRQIPYWIWHILRAYGPVPPVMGGWIPSALAGALGVACGVVGWRLTTRSNVRHIDGPRLNTSIRRAAKAFRPHLGGPGVPVHPGGVRIGVTTECHHLLVLGGPGSGKTTIIWPMLNAIIERGDRVLLLDVKGDFSSGIKRYTLLSPTDSRSARWSLGKDIQTRLDASSLAETLIPLGAGEPIWAQGARGLLTGLLSHLQTTKPGAWGFADLAELAAKVLVDYKLLVSIIIREHPPAKAFLMGADSKTTASFLGQLSGALSHVINVGVADYAARTDKKIGWSIRRWLADDYKGPCVAIIGWQSSSREFSQSFAASIIEQTVRQLGERDETDPRERRVWICLDEVAQLGKLPSISSALVTLRSKSTRVLLGLQSVAQNEQEYDRQTLSIWSGATDTKIICKLKSQQDQQFAADLLGKRTVERYTHQFTQSGAGLTSRSGSWHRSEEHVMPQAAFGQKLGPDTKGVKAIILAGSEGASLLQWPFYKVVRHHAHRVVADWVKPGYARPRWGETPPPVADAPPDNNRNNGGLQGGAGGEALQIAIDAGVVTVCSECGEAYRRADADPTAAYRFANTGFSRDLYKSFPDRRTLTDAIKSIIDAAPNACACGAKPKAEDTQKKASQDREQVPDRSKSTTTKKPQQMQPSTSQAQAQVAPRKEKGGESDPFGDLVGGALADAILPGASVIIDIANTAGDATTLPGPGGAPPAPGIPNQPDEPEQSSEPEAGD
ncbi:MAG: type IV secretory system conjugative DNA transfer family protein [Acidiferrobacter sp.]